MTARPVGAGGPLGGPGAVGAPGYTQTPAAPETVTVDKWYSQLPEPRNSAARRGRQAAVVAAIVGAVQTITPPAVNVDQYWAQPNQPPKRLEVKAHQQPQPRIDPFPITVRTDWYAPLSEPTRRIVTRQGPLTWQEPFPRPLTPAWYTQLTEPTRRIVTRQGPLPTVDPFPITVTTRWYAPLSEPTRRIVTRQAPLPWQEPFVRTTTTPWYAQLDEPTRRIVRRQDAGSYPDPYPRLEGAAEVVTIDKYYAQLGEPTRRIVTRQGPLTWQEPFVRTTTTDWYAPLQEPTRRVVTRQGPLTWQEPFPRTVTAEWYAPLSEPVLRKGLRISLQQAVPAQDPFPQITISWYQRLDEPTRRIVRRQDAGAYPEAFPRPTTLEWFAPLGEPQRFRQGLASTQQRQPDWTTFQFEVVTVDKWFVNLSEPQRFRLSLAERLQQHHAYVELDQINPAVVSPPDGQVGDVWRPSRRDIDAYKKRVKQLAKAEALRKAEAKKLERRLDEALKWAYLDATDPEKAAQLRAAIAEAARPKVEEVEAQEPSPPPSYRETMRLWRKLQTDLAGTLRLLSALERLESETRQELERLRLEEIRMREEEETVLLMLIT